MTKKLLIVAPNAEPGQPVTERMRAFADFFHKENIEIGTHSTPGSPREFVGLVRRVYKEGYRNILLTMPPFRNWSICFLPRVNVILDIRDGWSIAMRSGYGGTSKATPFKAGLARMVEQIAISASALTITCTPGLATYHSTKWARGKIVLVPNGFPDRDFPIVQELIQQSEMNKRSENDKRFICAGKFSEYGPEKVKEIISHISKTNQGKMCTISVYGNSKEQNEWVNFFIEDNNIDNVIFINEDSLDRLSILKNIIDSDYGITILRDYKYDLGTKIFDYIACGKKVLTYPFTLNSFTEYFKSDLHGGLETEFRATYLRSRMIEKKREYILGSLK